MGKSGRDCNSQREYKLRAKALYRQPEKKQPFRSEESLFLIKDKGIEGDVHGDGGKRQILIFTDAQKACYLRQQAYQKKWMEAQDIKGFCFSKLKENILLEGSAVLESGDVLKAGEAELIVTQEKKECYPEMCKFSKKNEKCMLAGAHLFASVRKGGKISRETICTLKKEQ